MLSHKNLSTYKKTEIICIFSTTMVWNQESEEEMWKTQKYMEIKYAAEQPMSQKRNFNTLRQMKMETQCSKIFEMREKQFSEGSSQ